VKGSFRKKFGEFDVKGLMKLAKKMGLNINKNIICEDTFRCRESCSAFKEKLFRIICKLINDENSLSHMISPPPFVNGTGPIYKYFVGCGNNAIVIRTLMKS
jgi:hypothetical protein